MSNPKKPNPIDVHVGKRLREAREECGLTQKVLAKKLGITHQQVQKYESGANRISASKLLEIARFLDVSIGSFFECAPGNGSDQQQQ